MAKKQNNGKNNTGNANTIVDATTTPSGNNKATNSQGGNAKNKNSGGAQNCK